VITVCYNSESTIEKCLQSVISQDYNNIEHIIVDGNSSDKTLEIISSFRIKSHKIISENDNGIYDAMNKGIKMASGDIIGMLNSDDFFYSCSSIKYIVEEFKKDNTFDCVYGNLVYLNNKNKIYRNWISQNFNKGLFQKSWTPAHPTFYCRKKVYDELQPYKLNYIIAADVEFMLRVLEVNNYKSSYINKYLVSMKLGGISNEGLKSTILITKEMHRAFKENKLKFSLIKYIIFKFLKLYQFINKKS